MFGQKSILVLSDRPKYLAALEKSFEINGVTREGYSISYFTDAASFFARLHDFQEAKNYTKFPLLVVFLQQNNGRALSLLKEIRNKALGHWPVIGFARHLPVKELQAAFDGGLNGYFEVNDLDGLAETVAHLEWLNDLPASLPDVPGEEWMQAG